MSTAPSPVEPAPMNAFARLFGVLFNPKETYADIARAPGWILPVLLYIALGLAVTAIFTQRVGWESFLRRQFERNPRFADLPEDRKQDQLRPAVKFAPYSTSVFIVIFNFVGPLAVGGVLMGAFRVAAGTNLTYKQSLGIVSHSYMPLAVNAVLGILILYLKPPEQVDLQNLVASNLGALLSSDAPRWQQSLGQPIDIFSFWVIFLLAAGFSTADPKKIKMGKAMGVVIGAWLLYVLAKVGLTAAFS